MKHPPRISANTSKDSGDTIEFLRIVKLAADRLSHGFIIYEKPIAKIIYANEAAERILGYQCEELVSMSNRFLHRIVHEQDLNKIQEFLNEGQDGRFEPTSLEHRFIRGDGKVIWIETFKTETNLDDKVYGIFVISEITEKKLREKDIVRREERYRLLYENLSDALFITDIRGNITMCNPQAVNLFGYSESELLGMNFQHLIHPDGRDSVKNAFEESLETGKTRGEGIVAKALRKDGKAFYYHVTSSVITNDGRHVGFQSLIRDITESKLSEIKLRNSMKDLELYSSFLKHDIRHELQIIATSSGILSEISGRESSTYSNSGLINNSVGRINNILNFMDTSDVTPSTGDIIVDLEKSALQAMRIHENLNVVLEINPTVKDIPLSRGALIGLVFNNIFQNAAIHAGEQVNMRVQVRIKDDSLVMHFMDDGKDIAKEIRASLFRKGTSTRGTGLGLYLSRRVIEEYNGKIEYIDDNNPGATFRVILPIEI